MKTEQAKAISNLVNNTLFDPLKVGTELSTDHRHLQGQTFAMFLHFMGNLSEMWEKGQYDLRNEFACKCAHVAIKALESEDLYNARFWLDEYKEVKEQLC